MYILAISYTQWIEAPNRVNGWRFDPCTPLNHLMDKSPTTLRWIFVCHNTALALPIPTPLAFYSIETYNATKCHWSQIAIDIVRNQCTHTPCTSTTPLHAHSRLRSSLYHVQYVERCTTQSQDYSTTWSPNMDQSGMRYVSFTPNSPSCTQLRYVSFAPNSLSFTQLRCALASLPTLPAVPSWGMLASLPTLPTLPAEVC